MSFRSAILVRAAVSLLVLFGSWVSRAESAGPEKPADTGWPRSFQSGADTVTIYQPQLDSWDGNRLESHMAVSIRAGGAGEPVFGVVELAARTEVDKISRLVTLRDVTLPLVRFPSAPERAEPFRKAIEKRLSSRPEAISLDRLEAALQILRAQAKGDALPLRNDPPRILFSSQPAILVSIDGEPAFRPLSGTKLTRVVNTRPIVLRDETGTLYLHLFDGWMRAASPSGAWTVAADLPAGRRAELEKALQSVVKAKTGDPLSGTGAQPSSKPPPPPSLAKGPVPAVIVATTPTELIVTDGPPDWIPIEGTKLLYVRNTGGRVFKHLADQKTYLLLAGRWFSAPGADGPWQFVAGSDLPEDFALIPDDSPMENVKAAVPGTPQAQEAVIANSIPQTASVKKAEVKPAPIAFDGEPALRAIEGTPLQYVVNASSPVIMVDPKTWYACQNGVWFTAAAVRGPWLVASSVPAVIYSIPPNSPIHYVTYVRVYQATPEVVYVGYTPGYTGAIVTGGVVVYGTGYVYRPWVGVVWYGAPVTYGYCVNIGWTPWYGWGYAAGYGYAWGWGGYYAGAYGAAVGPYGAVAWGPGGWAATTGNVYGHWGSTSAVSRASGGYNAWTGNAWAGQSGAAYNSRTGNAAAGQRGAVGNVYTGNYAAGSRGVVTNTNTGATAVGAHGTVGNAYTGESVSGGRGAVYNPNTGQTTTAAGVHGAEGGIARVGDDVYAGKDGNVYRNTGTGWEQHTSSGWSSVGGQNPRPELEGQRQARGAGEQRFQNFRSAGGAGGRQRPSGRRR